VKGGPSGPPFCFPFAFRAIVSGILGAEVLVGPVAKLFQCFT
jgi:hypothetical protein